MKILDDNTISLEPEEVKSLCKPGELANTCIWLMVGPRGFECSFYSRPTGLVSRWNQGLTVAKRNGCSKAKDLDLEVKYVKAKTLADVMDEPVQCPYQQECATIIYWSKEKADFIKEVCNTSEYTECIHYFGSLKPQHDERERLHGDPHYGEPDWDKEKTIQNST